MLLFFTYRQFIWEPGNEKSKDGYWIAQNYIAKDSTDKAIAVLIPFVKKNDGKIGGEMGQYLLATQYMKKGEFKKALTNLEGVSINDTYISVLSIGLQGDCYSELKKYEQALALYMEAADADDNEFTSPMYLFKAGGCADQLDKFDEISRLRKRNYQLLFDIFSPYEEYFHLPRPQLNADVNWFAFPLTIRENSPFKRSDMCQYLESKKIQTRPYFAGNILMQPAYSHLIGDLQLKDFPVANFITTNTFFLGTSPVITEEQISYIKEMVDSFMRNYHE